MDSSNLTLSLVGLLQTEWNAEVYPSYYDQGYCLQQNVTYENRVNIQDNFNFCSVPLSGADAFLFAALALLVASVCMGKLQSVWVLIIGGCLGILNYEVNLQRLGNSISLWLGIQPPDLFFYAFLPPLLVDAALRLDWYIFSKLWPHILLMAYAMVIINAAVLAPFILFVLGFSSRGWDWIHGAVLAAMLAPTDAVAVTAILKAGGGPEDMVVLMEGEALLNDASAVTLYTIFLHILIDSSPDDLPSVSSEIWPIFREIFRLTGIGLGVGLAFAWTLGFLLKLLRWRGAKPYIESLVVLATAYLAFYVSQGPARGSGVISVCVFGLYGAATGHWGMLATDAESGIHEAVWDTVAFAANALVFFWSGISAVNFVRRAAGQLEKDAWNYAAIPIIYLGMYVFRGACLVVFNPVFKLLGRKLSLPEICFTMVAGLRGSLTLIMAADFIIHSDFYSGGPVDEANFDVVLWASAFVLLSLLMNAPSIGPVMHWTGLSNISPDKVRGRTRAVEELAAFTKDSIAYLKQQQDGEFLQGANWSLVATFVDHTMRLKGFIPKPRGRRGIAQAAGGKAGARGRFWEQKLTGSCMPCGRKAAAPSAGAADKKGNATAASKSTSREGPRDQEDNGQDLADFEVPFIARQSSHGAAFAASLVPRSSDAAGHALNVTVLRATAMASHTGSFYNPASVADAAVAAAAVAISGVEPSAVASKHGTVRLGSGTDVTVSVLKPPSATATSAVLDGEEEVEMLFNRQDESGGNFDAKWQHSLGCASATAAAAAELQGSSPRAGPGPPDEDPWTANALQQQVAANTGVPAALAAAAILRQQVATVAASRAAAAGAGSTRDLLGRLQSPAMWGARDGEDESRAAPATTQQLSTALLSRVPANSIAKKMSKHLTYGNMRSMATSDAAASRHHTDLETGMGADANGGSGGSGSGGFPKVGTSSEDEEGRSLAEMRRRILHGMKRHFRTKRMAGLLSPDGLRVAIYACDKAIEEVEKHPDQPLQLWQVLRKEISGTWATHAVAAVLGGTLHLHRSAPRWWRQVWTVPFKLFTGFLRRHLGSKMLIACEATVELYMGLAASPQMQWVYFSEDGPVEVLEEVQEQLLGAHEFIQEREAEAPAQYRAVQSYRAAMAVLHQQRTFIDDLYERGGVDEEEREALQAAVDAAMRHLDMTGPIWRPPAPMQVLRSLDVFSAAPLELTDLLLQHARLSEHKPGALVWSSDEQEGGGQAAGSQGGGGASPAAGGLGAGSGFYLVVSGVVRHEYVGSDGSATQQLAGVGSMFGLLPGLAGSRLPGSELVLACGNSFGRGPVVYHFSAAAVEALRKRAAGGDAAAAALEVELLRVVALHTVQHVQGDVQGLVKSYLERHRPLTKYSAATQLHSQLPERVGRYTAQVLLDMLQAIPTATIVRLRAGDQYKQGAHMLLLQGSLRSSSGGDAELPAPAVLPWLTHNRFSFVTAMAAAEQGQQQLLWRAGSGGTTLLVCGVGSIGCS